MLRSCSSAVRYPVWAAQNSAPGIGSNFSTVERLRSARSFRVAGAITESRRIPVFPETQHSRFNMSSGSVTLHSGQQSVKVGGRHLATISLDSTMWLEADSMTQIMSFGGDVDALGQLESGDGIRVMGVEEIGGVYTIERASSSSLRIRNSLPSLARTTNGTIIFERILGAVNLDHRGR